MSATRLKQKHYLFVILISVLSYLMVAAIRPVSHPWLRISTPMENLKISADGEFIAFTDKSGFNLHHHATGSHAVALKIS